MSTSSKSERFAAAVQHTRTPTTSTLVAALGSLLAYAPFAGWLANDYLPFAIAGGAIVLGMSRTPDTITWRFIPHGWTHSPVGATALGAVVAAPSWWVASNIAVHAGGVLVTPLAAAKFGFALGALAGLGHTLGDLLTGTDVRPLFPMVNRSVSINLPRLLDPRDNDGVNFVGTMVVLCVVVALLSSGATAMTIP
ncbi:metal-dependent hydrolase [Halococcus salsus]|uniref:metal-dependent hydrolase n=1 Tax=Halococcus salsus TaxID=2162894 RepID=UPI0013574CBC|nr:metal-dependent hydrolase [Halococcus salsus]